MYCFLNGSLVNAHWIETVALELLIKKKKEKKNLQGRYTTRSTELFLTQSCNRKVAYKGLQKLAIYSLNTRKYQNIPENTRT